MICKLTLQNSTFAQCTKHKKYQIERKYALTEIKSENIEICHLHNPIVLKLIQIHFVGFYTNIPKICIGFEINVEKSKNNSLIFQIPKNKTVKSIE